MRLGLNVPYSGAHFSIDMGLVRLAEDLGYHSAWTSEAWGSDAVTPAAWILAQTTRLNVGTGIIQMPARQPAAAAMMAMTLQDLSGGRFILGIGPSGPQVIEGWYGVPYGRPITRTREYVSIVRKILAREVRLEHEGFHYQIPYRSVGAMGLGKPLKSILHGDPTLKIVTGAIAPAGIRVAAEVADGFLPIWMNPDKFGPFEAPLAEGFAMADCGKSLKDFMISPDVAVRIGDDLDACRAPIKADMALYIGGMGARDKNFYNDYCKRLGYEDAAVKIQDLFLDGKRAEAAATVPDALVDEVALVGSRERIAERLGAWKAAAAKGHVDTIVVSGATPDVLRLLAEEVL